MTVTYLTEEYRVTVAYTNPACDPETVTVEFFILARSPRDALQRMKEKEPGASRIIVHHWHGAG